jgi:hypothetical protein
MSDVRIQFNHHPVGLPIVITIDDEDNYFNVRSGYVTFTVRDRDYSIPFSNIREWTRPAE